MNNNINRNVNNGMEEDLAAVLGYMDYHNFRSVQMSITPRQLLSGEFDVQMAPCQRNECSKKPTMDSHVLCHIAGNGFGQLQASLNGGKVLYVVDGQQRVTSLLGFIKGESTINVKKTSLPIDERRSVDRRLIEVLDKKKFSDLSVGLQNHILDRPISFEVFHDMTERQMANLYIVKNTSSVVLNKTECSKAKANSNVWKRVDTLTKNATFNNMKVAGRNARLSKEKNVLEMLCIQLDYLDDDAFSDNIDTMIAELNQMSDEELDVVFESFLDEKAVYDGATLYAIAKNCKRWGKGKKETYHFFDERLAFYLFHKFGVDGTTAKEDVVKAIKENSDKLFTSEDSRFADAQGKYKHITSNGSDKVTSMKKASALIFNGEE